jgi:hypothetical protein
VGCRDGELTQGERLNGLTRLCQPGVKGAQRIVLTEIFSVEPEREAKAIATACSTLILLDLKQGAIATSLRSPQGGWRHNTEPEEDGHGDLGSAPESRSHAEPSFGISMLASLEQQTLGNRDRPVSSRD